MKKYRATVIDEQTGSQKVVTVEAASAEAAAGMLRADGLIPLRLEASRVGRATRRRTFPARQAAIYFRQLRSLLRNGRIRTADALRLLADLAPPRYRDAATQIAEQVAQGSSLAEAVRQSGLFPPIAAALIEVGEQAGELDTIVDALARYFERQAYYAGKVKSALTYPAAVMGLAVLMTYAMLAFLVPQFVGLLKELNAQIPTATRVVIAISDFLRSPWTLAVIGALWAGMVLLRRRMTEQPEFAEKVERLILKVPVVSTLVSGLTLALFARTLELQLRAGLQLPLALRQTAQVVSLASYRRALDEAANLVEQGQRLNQALSHTPELFPRLVLSLIRVGERTGDVDEMLAQLTSIYEEEADALLQGLSGIIEPLLLIGVGIVIGGIMLAILLPYFAVAQQIGSGL